MATTETPANLQLVKVPKPAPTDKNGKKRPIWHNKLGD